MDLVVDTRHYASVKCTIISAQKVKLNVCKVIKSLIGGYGNPGWNAECDKTSQLYDRCMKGERCVGGKYTELYNFGNE